MFKFNVGDVLEVRSYDELCGKKVSAPYNDCTVITINDGKKHTMYLVRDNKIIHVRYMDLSVLPFDMYSEDRF